MMASVLKINIMSIKSIKYVVILVLFLSYLEQIFKTGSLIYQMPFPITDTMNHLNDNLIWSKT